MLYDLALITGIMITAAAMTVVGWKAFDYLYWRYLCIKSYYQWKKSRGRSINLNDDET